MEMSENLIKYVKLEAKRVHHGKIIIEINETANKVDIVTESRERFPNAEDRERKIKNENKEKFRNG